MMPDLSPEAQARARRTIMVAAVFDEHADEIEAAVVEVSDGEVLVAVVDAQHEFAGLHRVETNDLIERVAALEGPGWAMVFSPGADAASVRRRTAEMAGIAAQRIAAIERINARREGV
jgi:metallophosphoesterase superfamily enzyme